MLPTRQRRISFSALKAPTAFLTLLIASSSALGATLRLMPLGDSITSGFQSSTGNGYRAALFAKLVDQGNPTDFVGSIRDGDGFDPDHEGHSGYRIDQIAALTPAAVRTYQPNVVTLHVGSNDMGQNYQVATAPNRLASLIDAILAAAPAGTTVLVAQLIPNSDPAVQSRINAYNGAIPGIVQARANAGKRVALVGMGALTTADLYDGLHPNDKGYAKMANAWYGAVQDAVSRGWITNLDFAGVYELQLVSNGLAADVSGGSTGNNAPIVQWPYGGGRNQLWNLIPTDGGYYQIKSANSGLDMNVAGVSKSPGAPVVQWPFGTQGNDQWRPVRNSDGSWTFYNRNSGLVLTNNGGSQQSAQFVQDTYRNAASQRFNVIRR